MQKIITILPGMLLFTIIASAQITITADDVAPVGFTAVLTSDTMPDASIVPGGTGLQTWNFSALKDQEQSSITFVEPANTPFSALFPASNLAADQGGMIYLYLNKDDDRVTALGSYGEFTFDTFSLTAKVILSPPQTLIRYPSTLNDAYTETIRSIVEIKASDLDIFVFDSIRSVTTSQRSVIIDAFGNITTPFGSFESLRSTSTELEWDSIYVKVNNNWQLIDADPFPDTTTSWSWWTNEGGLGYPIMQLTDSPEYPVLQALWLKEATSSSKETANMLPVSLFPNPASGWVNVELTESFEGRLLVQDFNGRLAFSKEIKGFGGSISLDGLSPGSYLAVLMNQQGQMAGFKRFEVTR